MRMLTHDTGVRISIGMISSQDGISLEAAFNLSKEDMVIVRVVVRMLSSSDLWYQIINERTKMNEQPSKILHDLYNSKTSKSGELT